MAPNWYDYSSVFSDSFKDFECAVPVSTDTPEAKSYGLGFCYLPWEFEIQTYFNIAEANYYPENDAIRFFAVVDPEEKEEPIIRGMTWVHVSEGQWKDSTGYFHLSAIARAYKYRRLHIGDLLLMDALHQCWLNHSRFGRILEVHALIDYRNKPSIQLFERHGFQRVEHVHYIEGRYLEYILPSDAEEWEDAANWKYAPQERNRSAQ